MKLICIPFTAFTLFCSIAFASIALSTHLRSETFQPGGEFDEYDPYQITFSEPFTEEIIHTETIAWQVVSYLSSREGEEAHEISLSAEYEIPEAMRNSSESIRYMLTGGPEDKNRSLPTFCTLLHDNGGATMIEPGKPITYRNIPITSIFCLTVVKLEEVQIGYGDLL